MAAGNRLWSRARFWAPRRRRFLFSAPLMICTVIVASILLPCTGAAAERGNNVAIQGSGTLTTCRSWVLFESCTTHKVRLPERVSAGDRVQLTFGSNNKSYTFHVALIRLEGNACTLLSQDSRVEGEAEKIEIPRCVPVAEPPTASQ
jgi:hypothetical protein